MPLLRIPEPYDFELSTRRFRDFGSDGATVLVDDGLAPRRRRSRGADRRRAWRCRDRAVERRGGGGGRPARSVLPFDLDAFRAWAADEPTLARDRRGAAGLPADAEPAAVRGARRRDHDAADLAARGGGDPREPRPGVWRAARARLGVPDARADPRAAPAPLHAARLLPREGGVRARARALRRSISTSSRRSTTTR